LRTRCASSSPGATPPSPPRPGARPAFAEIAAYPDGADRARPPGRAVEGQHEIDLRDAANTIETALAKH
jgi:hypothetical protein